MHKISVRLFGIPEIRKNDDIINLPFKKSEALIYYLVINKKATREELIGLLWSDKSESDAKANLRNTLYVIRKVFDTDIFDTNSKSIITFNEDVDIVTDLDMFTSDDDCLDYFRGELLKGFFVKDCEEFELWLLNLREYYNNLFIDKIKNIIQNSNINDKRIVERYCNLLIEIDRFSEYPYKILMEMYENDGQFNKAIHIYKKLGNILKDELNITPSMEINEIYNRIIRLKNINQKINQSSSDLFYGRTNEINYLYDNLISFLKSEKYKSILITGEAGIGKTRLLNKFLSLFDGSQVFLFKADCYYDESNCILKPWYLIVKEIFNIINTIKNDIHIPPIWKNNMTNMFPFLDLNNERLEINFNEKKDSANYQIFVEALSNILKILANCKKVIFVFEDLQWIDKVSLNLLMEIILNNDILFLGTIRNEYNFEIDKFSTLLSKYNKLETLSLNRFTKNEVSEFLDLALPDFSFNEKQKEKIYIETEGNTFFLVEMLNSIKENSDYDFMSVKMEDFIKSRFLNITGNKRNILNMISLFFDGVNLKLLNELTNMNENEIIEIIEELCKKNIIEQKFIDNDIIFKFTHQKLRKYIYDNLSMIRKKVLHEKVANALEKKLIGDYHDVLLYSKIIYNFEKSGNRLKYLEYTLKHLTIYLDYNHELYPKCNIPYTEKENGIFDITNEKIMPYFQELDNEIKELENQMYSINELLKLKIMVNFIRGRYLISIGHYDEGILSINRVIEYASEIQNYEYLLMGHRQMIFCYIQTNDLIKMKEEIQVSLNLSEEIGNKFEKATLLRLKGLNKMMNLEFSEAELLLNESISLFEWLNLRQDIYALNIAAAYNYLGEIKRLTMDFDTAINYYEKAIKICKQESVIKGLPIFYTNAGRCAIMINDLKEGERYIEDAIFLYSKLNILSGRSIAESLMAFIEFKKGKYDDTLRYLKNADIYSSIQNKAFELGVCLKTKLLIKSHVVRNPNLGDIFNTYLCQDIQYFYKEAKFYLEQANETYEIDELKSILHSNEIP